MPLRHCTFFITFLVNFKEIDKKVLKKHILFSYYHDKMNQALNSLWDSGVLNQEKLDEINNKDLHKLKSK